MRSRGEYGSALLSSRSNRLRDSHPLGYQLRRRTPDTVVAVAVDQKDTAASQAAVVLANVVASASPGWTAHTRAKPYQQAVTTLSFEPPVPVPRLGIAFPLPAGRFRRILCGALGPTSHPLFRGSRLGGWSAGLRP